MTDRAKLTAPLVRRVEFRMQHGAGLVSVRQAILIDEAGVTDLDLATWLERGEALRVKGISSTAAGVSDDDRLCIRLCELDTNRYTPTLMKAGEAMQEILVSQDPRAMGPKVKLITKLIELTAPAPGTEDARQVGYSQEVMDKLTRAELRELDKIREARMQLTARESAIMLAAKARLESESKALGAAREDMH